LNWFEFERDEKTLFFTGPSGTGKTEGLLSIFDQDKAIKRRIRHVEISKPMFTQNNIYINVSVNNF
jgi:hypothetical protein